MNSVDVKLTGGPWCHTKPNGRPAIISKSFADKLQTGDVLTIGRLQYTVTRHEDGSLEATAIEG